MSDHVKGMTSCRPPESEISNEKSNESENSLKESENLQPTCNQLATDTIDREAAIDALGGNEPVGDPSKMDDYDVAKMWERIRIINIINKLPSAQPDLSGYSDRLWKAAYERGKAEAQPDIIHCGECKYYDNSDGCFFSTATTGADGFCHWAERKEGEADEAD